MEGYACPSTMSKRRYAELEKMLAEGLPEDHVEFALRAVRDALKVDPAATQHTPKLGKRRAECCVAVHAVPFPYPRLAAEPTNPTNPTLYFNKG